MSRRHRNKALATRRDDPANPPRPTGRETGAVAAVAASAAAWVRSTWLWCFPSLHNVVTTGLMVLAGAVFGATMWKGLSTPGLTIEDIKVPPALQRQGYSPAVVTTRFLDAFEDLKHVAQESAWGWSADSARGMVRPERMKLDVNKIDLAIPGTGSTLNQIVGVLRPLFGVEETTINGEFTCPRATCELDDYRLTMHVAVTNADAPEGRKSRVTLAPAKADDFGTEIRNAALATMGEMNPLLVAAYHAGRDDHATAVSFYTMAITRDPKHGLTHMLRGHSRAKIGRHDKAVEDFTEALKHDPYDPFLHRRRGDSLAAMKKYDDAIADYALAISFKSDYDYAFYSRAQAHFERGDNKKGDFDQAVADISAAITLAPTDAYYHYTKGDYLARMGARDEATKDFSTAIELAPNDPFYHRVRGSNYVELGDHEQAIEDFSRAIDLNPGYKLAYRGRAESYRALGDGERAAADDATAKRLD